MTVEKQVLSALKWTSLAKLIGQVTSWGVTLVVLRLLAPADYGLMAIVSMIIAVLVSMAEMGLGSSLVQAPKLEHSDISVITGAVIALNLAIGLLVVFLAPVAAWFFAEPRLTLLIRVASLQFALNALCTIPQAVAFREMNFKWLARVELAVVLSGGLTTLALAWEGFGVWALLLGSLLQGTVRTALLLRGGMPRPIFRLEGLRRHVTFGGTLAAVNLTTQIVYQSDIFFAGRLLSQQALGLYSVSVHLATLPMQKIMSVINQVTFPAVARLQHDRERLRVRMIEATRLLMAFSLPALWGLSAVAPEFVVSILGAKWAGAVFPLQAVCLVVPMRMLNMIYNTAVLGVGDIRVNVSNAMAAAIILPLAFLLGAHWGVDGLAAAWVVAIPSVSLFRLPKMLEIVAISVSDLVASLRGPVLAGAIMYAAVTAARLSCEALPAPARLALLVAVGACAYIGGVLLLDRRIVPDVLRVVRAMRG